LEVALDAEPEIRECVTFAPEPRAQKDCSLEMLWLHLHLKHRKSRLQHLSIASAYLPNSSRDADDISTAWDAFREALSNAATDDHQYIVLGDLNARIGSATHDTDRYGQYGEPADDSKSVNRAG
jgi:exonuclease III